MNAPFKERRHTRQGWRVHQQATPQLIIAISLVVYFASSDLARAFFG